MFKVMFLILVPVVLAVVFSGTFGNCQAAQCDGLNRKTIQGDGGNEEKEQLCGDCLDSFYGVPGPSERRCVFSSSSKLLYEEMSVDHVFVGMSMVNKTQINGHVPSVSFLENWNGQKAALISYRFEPRLNNNDQNNNNTEEHERVELYVGGDAEDEKSPTTHYERNSDFDSSPILQQGMKTWVVDLDRDAIQDIIVLRPDLKLEWFRGDVSGNYEKGQDSFLNGLEQLNKVSIGFASTLTGKSKIVVVGGNSSQNTPAMYSQLDEIQNGFQMVENAVENVESDESSSFSLHDINGDLKLDLFVTRADKIEMYSQISGNKFELVNEEEGSNPFGNRIDSRFQFSTISFRENRNLRWPEAFVGFGRVEYGELESPITGFENDRAVSKVGGHETLVAPSVDFPDPNRNFLASSIAIIEERQLPVLGYIHSARNGENEEDNEFSLDVLRRTNPSEKFQEFKTFPNLIKRGNLTSLQLIHFNGTVGALVLYSSNETDSKIIEIIPNVGGSSIEDLTFEQQSSPLIDEPIVNVDFPENGTGVDFPEPIFCTQARPNELFVLFSDNSIELLKWNGTHFTFQDSVDYSDRFIPLPQFKFGFEFQEGEEQEDKGNETDHQRQDPDDVDQVEGQQDEDQDEIVLNSMRCDGDLNNDGLADCILFSKGEPFLFLDDGTQTYRQVDNNWLMATGMEGPFFDIDQSGEFMQVTNNLDAFAARSHITTTNCVGKGNLTAENGICDCESNFQGQACQHCEFGFYGHECASTCPPQSSSDELALFEANYPEFPTVDSCLCESPFVEAANSNQVSKACGCPQGFGFVNETCETCPTHFIQNVTGSRESCVQCAPGYTSNEERTACKKLKCQEGQQLIGEVLCIPCPKGFYRDAFSNSDDCVPCPEHVPITASTGTSSVEECLVPSGSFLLPGGSSDDVVVCGEGLNCENPGNTLESLVLLPGYWRISNQSIDILPCPNPEYCHPTSTAPSSSSSSSSPQSSNDNRRVLGSLSERRQLENEASYNSTIDTYCTSGHQGILCDECIENYALDGDVCKFCSEELEKAHATSFGGIVGLLVLIGVAPSIYLIHKARSWHRESLGYDAEGDNCKCAPTCCSLRLSFPGIWKEAMTRIGAHLRICIGFFQVAIQFRKTKDEVDALPGLSLLTSFDISTIGSWVDFGCAHRWDFYTRLLVYTIVPISIIILLSVSMLGIEYCLTGGYQRAGVKYFTLILQMFFLIYPGVSTQIFRTFLQKDYSISYHEDSSVVTTLAADHSLFFTDYANSWRAYAIVMVFVYPVFILLVFIRAITAWKHRQHGWLGEASGFLCNAIKPESAYWEAVELVRKLSLTSFYLLFDQAIPNDGAVLVYLFLVVGFLILLLKMKPYKQRWNQIHSEIALFMLFLLGISGNDNHSSDSLQRGFFIFFLTAECFILLAFVTMEFKFAKNVSKKEVEMETGGGSPIRLGTPSPVRNIVTTPNSSFQRRRFSTGDAIRRRESRESSPSSSGNGSGNGVTEVKNFSDINIA